MRARISLRDTSATKAAARSPRLLATWTFILLLTTIGWAPPTLADDFRFAPFVTFRLNSAVAAGEQGTLATKITDKDIQMRLANVSAAGADKSQEMWTFVDKSDLSLIQSVIYDPVNDKKLRLMVRKSASSILDNKKTDVFEYTETKDGKLTTTEPYVEFKVVDFLSVMLVAAEAIHRKDTKNVDLSMLRDRSVTRVVMHTVGPENVGGQSGTHIRVAPPDNPTGGVSYVIARTRDGTYYPARIRMQTSQGPVQLEGLPQ